MKQNLKLLLLAVLTLALCVTSLPATVLADTETPAVTDGWPEPPELVSEAAIVMEASTGSILYNKNAFDSYYPASTTKLMTSLLAIEQCPLSDVITGLPWKALAGTPAASVWLQANPSIWKMRCMLFYWHLPMRFLTLWQNTSAVP